MATATAGNSQGESWVCTFWSTAFELTHPWLFLRSFPSVFGHKGFEALGPGCFCWTQPGILMEYSIVISLENEGKHPEFYGLESHLVLEVWPITHSKIPQHAALSMVSQRHFRNAYMSLCGSIHPENHPFGVFELIFLVTISYQLPLHSPKMLEHIILFSQLSVSNHNHRNLTSLLRQLKGTFAWMFSTLIIGANICICFSFPITTHTSLAYTNGLKCLSYD